MCCCLQKLFPGSAPQGPDPPPPPQMKNALVTALMAETHLFLGRVRLRVELALWSHVCVIVVEDPPPLAG